MNGRGHYHWSLLWGIGIFFMISAALLARDQALKIQIQEVISEKIRAQLRQPTAEIQVRLIRFPKFVMADSGRYRLSLQARTPNTGFGYQVFEGKYDPADSPPQEFTVSAKISVNCKVLIADQHIRRGEALTSGKYRFARRKINRDFEHVFTELAAIQGMEATTFIKTGTVLSKNLLRRPPDMKRGARVQVRIIRGNLVITTPGISRGDGNIGDTILIKCEPGGKRLTGIIESPGWVFIRI